MSWQPHKGLISSNQASAAEDSSVSVISINPATIRIDNPACRNIVKTPNV
jgi:hypothetical protein